MNKQDKIIQINSKIRHLELDLLKLKTELELLQNMHEISISEIIVDYENAIKSNNLQSEHISVSVIHNWLFRNIIRVSITQKHNDLYISEDVKSKLIDYISSLGKKNVNVSFSLK